jgi:hypothetical protein
MKYKARRTRRSRRTRGGTTYGSKEIEKQFANEAAADCEAHVRAQLDGLERKNNSKKQPYWEFIGYKSLAEAKEKVEALAREQSPCKSEAVVVVEEPVQNEEATVRAPARVAPPRPNPFAPQGAPRSPEVVGPTELGCTGPFCRGGKSRRRKGRKSRRRITRRR